MSIRAIVYGSVHFPEHPEREGAGGIIGGEDLTAERRTFRSPGEAMTWARKVLDGELVPATLYPLGELLEPRTEPYWSEARVVYEYGQDEQSWVADHRAWYEERGDGNRGPEVREDHPPAVQAAQP